jgi:hypothetical protein
MCAIYQYEFPVSAEMRPIILIALNIFFFLLNAAFVTDTLDLISRVYVASSLKQLLELM